MSVLIGDVAPDFNLIDQNVDEFYLKEFIGKERIIIYFYPKDETPGCVAQACGFRDNFEEFDNLVRLLVLAKTVLAAMLNSQSIITYLMFYLAIPRKKL